MPTALVTGAAGAIGVETVIAFAREGYSVAATDRPGADWAPLERALAGEPHPDRVRQFDLDVTDPSSVELAVAAVLAWSGPTLDVVVNNAGVRSAGLFTHTPAAAHRRMFDVNYLGVANVTRATLPIMRRQGRGHVVVVSSVGALAGLPGLAGYCASKAAVEGWTESVAMELRSFGVRFTLIEPASVRSGIWASGEFHVDDNAPDAALARLLHTRDEASQASAGDPRGVATAIMRTVRARWTPTRVPVGATAIARHAARGVVPPSAQRAVLRRALQLDSPPASAPVRAGGTVLVTGTSSGLGQHLVGALHDEGWRVIATVRDDGKEQALRSHLGGRDIDIVHMDQAHEASVQEAFTRVAAITGGALDALVANAGVKVTAPFEDLPDEAMRTMIDVNVFGTWFVARAAIDLLRANHGGRIVVIGSSSGFTGMPTWSGYAASKFALEAWTESLAYEVEPEAIRVTLVEPGTFKSEIYRDGSSVAIEDGPYRRLATTMVEREHASLARATGPAPIAERVVAVLRSSRPPTRTAVGTGARARQLVRGVIPGTVVQRLLAPR